MTEKILNEWKEDSYADPHYPLLAEQYMTVNDGILKSLGEEYADKNLPIAIRSTRPKKE